MSGLGYTLLVVGLSQLLHVEVSGCVLDWHVETFDCGNGFCVAMSSRCDTWRDCTNGRDEEDCPGDCPANQHKCLITDICIPKTKLCDGKIDCRWQDDETNCDSTSEPTVAPTSEASLDFTTETEPSLKDISDYLDSLKPWMDAAKNVSTGSDSDKVLYKTLLANYPYGSYDTSTVGDYSDLDENYDSYDGDYDGSGSGEKYEGSGSGEKYEGSGYWHYHHW